MIDSLITLPPDDPNAVFVFGSNEAGIHGAGAARYARVHYGAQPGIGFGQTGDAFAIPTMNGHFSPLKLADIRTYVARFLVEASLHPERTYYVTPIGCGIAGFLPSEIAPLFTNAPANVRLPDAFTAVLTPPPTEEVRS
ncbi:MAG: hypothetical protein IT356_12565 [Gemmatimonadaceae bacterium]|nr:hypothetical protein [Gemmatimonadaceae bacterium]